MRLIIALVIFVIVYAPSIYSQKTDCYTVELSSSKIHKNQSIKETYCKGKIASREARWLITSKDDTEQHFKVVHDSYSYDSLAYVFRVRCKTSRNAATASVDTVSIEYKFKTKFDDITNLFSKKQLRKSLNYLTLQKLKRNRSLQHWSDQNKGNMQWTYELLLQEDTLAINFKNVMNGRYAQPQIFKCYKVNDNSIYIQEIETAKLLRSGYKRPAISLEINFNSRNEIVAVTKYREDELLTYSYDDFGRIKKIKSNSDSYNDIEYAVIEKK